MSKMTEQNVILKIDAIQKSFQTASERVDVLTGVNLEIKAGQKIAIVGHSGAGKSTLLQIAGLLDTPSAGDVYVNGEKTSDLKDFQRTKLRNECIGFVYQQNHLLRDFTALENVMMPSLIAGKADEERALDLLQKVGLEHRVHHYPSEMSGGEQQRCAIARALMNRPEILLADEPTGNLDPATGSSVSKMLDEMISNEGMAMLVVTHNEELAASCDESYHMVDGKLVHADKMEA